MVLTGVGKSKRIAQVICDSYQSLGYKFLFLDPTDLLHGSLGVFSSFSKALLILLSKSGTTVDSVKSSSWSSQGLVPAQAETLHNTNVLLSCCLSKDRSDGGMVHSCVKDKVVI